MASKVGTPGYIGESGPLVSSRPGWCSRLREVSGTRLKLQLQLLQDMRDTCWFQSSMPKLILDNVLRKAHHFIAGAAYEPSGHSPSLPACASILCVVYCLIASHMTQAVVMKHRVAGTPYLCCKHGIWCIVATMNAAHASGGSHHTFQTHCVCTNDIVFELLVVVMCSPGGHAE